MLVSWLLKETLRRGVIDIHCVKSVCIWSCSGPHFATFGLTTEIYSVSLRIQSECGKIRTRINSNTDTFHTVDFFFRISQKYVRVNLKRDLQNF